jgi:hypothetical protein
MPTTLVIQSHRNPLPFNWLQKCIDSVFEWAASSKFDYRFYGDEIFDLVESPIRRKLRDRPVILSDLSRLKALQMGLAHGYQTVIWCDADFLIFKPQDLVLPQSEYALGRELWVQQSDSGKLRVYRKVHNAFMLFRRDNHFLDFYTDAAESLVKRNQGGMPPQFIGPKLLTALHNIVTCPVMEQAGMLSPMVMRDLLTGSGDALDLFRSQSETLPAAFNLSSSLTEAEGFSEPQMENLIQILMQNNLPGA